MKLFFPNGEHPQALLSPGINRIGNAGDAQIVLALPEISAAHAVIELDGDNATLTQADDSAAVAVNGKPISAPTPIRAGDQLTFGSIQARVVAVEKAGQGAAPPSCRDRESIFRSSRKRTWSDPGFKQGDNHPVVCVSAAMADGYAAWLSERTGKAYRLPSAAEMGKAGLAPAKECRGNVMDADFRKEFGGRAGFTCGDGHAWTAPAGAFAADNAGLYDTSGNVREWTRDCDAGNCRERQAAGASWFSDADDKPVRTFAADTAFNTIGLRVSRKID